MIFEHHGEALRPKLAIIDGRFVPGSALSFPDSIHIKIRRFAFLHGSQFVLTESREAYDTELKGGVSVPMQKGFSDGLYSNKLIKLDEARDYSDGLLVDEQIADSGGLSIGIHGLSKWTSDLNQNGASETWIQSGTSLQIWEGYKEKSNLLLLDLRRF